MLARIPTAFAATYELLIKGGRVIDRSLGWPGFGRDAGGRAKVKIAGDATDTIDARGKIVAPGLIDIHSHAGRTKEGRRCACRMV